MQSSQDNLLKDILSPDNALRSRAETSLNEQRTSNPSNLLQTFIANMKNEVEVEVAQMSCVLFKKYFLDGFKEGGDISADDLQLMKEAVISSLDFKNQPLILLRRKGDVIAKIYSIQGKQQELLDQLVLWARESDPVSKQFSMYLFEILSECHLSLDQLKQYKDSFYTIFEASLKDADVAVRVAALKATTTFMYSIEDEDVLKTFKALMPSILSTVVDALRTDETQGKLALESMVDLTRTHPQCWKETSTDLVKVVSEIIKQADFEDGTRSQATEIVLALAHEVPATLRKLPEMKSDFFLSLFQMLTECEDDLETWAEMIEGEDGSSGNDAHSAALGAIGRLSIDMKEKFTLAASGQIIEQSLTHEDWKVRQAGYLTFGVIAEACREHMKSKMEHTMQTSVKGLQDAHPRVRYAALTCLALLLTELSPHAQKKYHGELVPCLLSIIQNEKMLKLRTHAISCLINFTQGLIQEDENEIDETKKSSDIMALYSDQLYTTLITNLEQGILEKYEPLQEEVMNLLNVSATLIEEHFGKHFRRFLPLMINILHNIEPNNQSQMNLGARTIESIGFMVTAVTENRDLLPQVQDVTTLLFKMLDREFAHDDPQELAVKDSLAKMAYYLKEDFNVVAPKFIEILIKDASAAVDIKSEDAILPSTTAASQMQSFELKLKGMENKTRVSLNTSALGNKIAAFQHILKIAEAMGTSFEPYIPTVLPLLKADYKFFSKAVRKACLKTFQYLLVAKGEPANLTLFKEIYMLFALRLNEVRKQENVKEMKLVFKELFHCMRVIKDNEEEQNQRFFGTEADIEAFGKLVKLCLETVAVQKEHHLATIEEKHRNVDIDEEDLQEIKEELAKVTGAATYINECADMLMTTYKGQVKEVIDQNVRFFFGKVLQDYKAVSGRELQDATFFFMQYVENCDSSDKMMIYELCQQYAEICIWTTPEMEDVRQNTIYGIGVMSKHLVKEKFESLLKLAMKAIEHVLSDPEAATPEKEAVTENAIVTLGRVALVHTEDPVHVTKFLQALPLSGEEEAQEAHQILLEQTLAGNQVLTGDACKAELQQAVLRLKSKAAEDESILNDESKEMLTKVLSM